MEYQEFVSRVQYHARLNSRQEAAAAVFATLRTLGERLPAPEAQALARHLAAPLDEALLQSPGGAEAFTARHFFRRITDRTTSDLSQAIHRARAVIAVLHDAVPAETIQHIRDQLSADFKPLFTHKPE